MNQLTFKQYRSIDVTIFCVITVIFEALASLASNQWFVLQAMSVSITLTITCITMFRWGIFSVAPALLGALSYCITSGANPKQYVIYCGGSILCILALPLLKKMGKEKARVDFFRRSLLAVIVYLLTTMGRWIISLIFEPSLDTFLPFITTDSLSLLFAIVVLTLAKNIDGLIEDQKTYLLRLDRERKEEEQKNLQDPFNDPY